MKKKAPKWQADFQPTKVYGPCIVKVHVYTPRHGERKVYRNHAVHSKQLSKGFRLSIQVERRKGR